jgi:hypothetical protein
VKKINKTNSFQKMTTNENIERQMKKLHSREMRNQDKFRPSNCLLMCRNTAVMDQAVLFDIIKKSSTFGDKGSLVKHQLTAEDFERGSVHTLPESHQSLD